MRFIVDRASVVSGKPCDHAERAKVARYDRRTFKSFEEHDNRGLVGGGRWTERGTEHEVERAPDGTATGISRRLDAEEWVLWVPDLAALLDLVACYGPCTVEPPDRDRPPVLRIEDVSW